MIRHVRRDKDQIVRHLSARSATRHLSSSAITPDHHAIRQLPYAEHDKVAVILAEIKAAHQHHCTYLSADRLRAVIRGYIEALNAIRIRPTGGVYFVHHAHAAALTSLRELAARLGEGSYLTRVPIPDQDEMREMVIAAFTTRSRDELAKLAADIAGAQRNGATDSVIAALHKRFRDLHASAAEHATLLNTSLDDTTAVMRLVNAQLASLLASTS
jgi:hypothetical protein